MEPIPDPFDLFEEWYEEAHHVGLPEPSAASLATVNEKGHPSVRVVLVRGHDVHGFVFYTNLRSRKGRDLLRNASAGAPASLCFYWPPLARQVRVTGMATLVPDAEADAYWATRPRGSQVAAYASRQSERLPGGREELATRFRALDKSLPETSVPRPEFWSGFRIAPDEIEFWEGRENRLHQRLLYTRGDGGWTMEILAP
ncbi:MAG TPA: pyridoxamine 5'-phosphate oxidase [Candidatus Eisenbacteria bacterium]